MNEVEKALSTRENLHLKKHEEGGKEILTFTSKDPSEKGECSFVADKDGSKALGRLCPLIIPE